jgi:hypothetical protein
MYLTMSVKSAVGNVTSTPTEESAKDFLQNFEIFVFARVGSLQGNAAKA